MNEPQIQKHVEDTHSIGKPTEQPRSEAQAQVATIEALRVIRAMLPDYENATPVTRDT